MKQIEKHERDKVFWLWKINPIIVFFITCIIFSSIEIYKHQGNRGILAMLIVTFIIGFLFIWIKNYSKYLM